MRSGKQDIATSLGATDHQGRSKRSGWSGHGRTNNRAGKLYFFFKVFIIFFSGIIIEPGIFSILILKQRRHSHQNVHSDDSILGRFRPSIASRQSSSFDGWERLPGARVRWPLQRPSMRRRDYHGGSYTHTYIYIFVCVLQIELTGTSEQVSQTVLQVSQTVLR